MSYKVKVKKNVSKKIRTIPKAYIPKIYLIMKGLAENPRPNNSKKLQGDSNAYRLRVGVYRLIYSIDDKAMVVDIEKLIHRQDGY